MLKLKETLICWYVSSVSKHTLTVHYELEERCFHQRRLLLDQRFEPFPQHCLLLDQCFEPLPQRFDELESSSVPHFGGNL